MIAHSFTLNRIVYNLPCRFPSIYISLSSPLPLSFYLYPSLSISRSLSLTHYNYHSRFIHAPLYLSPLPLPLFFDLCSSPSRGIHNTMAYRYQHDGESLMYIRLSVADRAEFTGGAKKHRETKDLCSSNQGSCSCESFWQFSCFSLSYISVALSAPKTGTSLTPHFPYYHFHTLEGSAISLPNGQP